MNRSSVCLPAAAAALLPGAAFAAAPGPDAGSLVQVVLGLLAVVVAVLLLARFLPRLQGVRPGGRGQLRVVDSLPLGQKERIVLVEVGDRQLLIGVTAAQVCTLHALDEPLAVGRTDDGANAQRSWLERVLARGRP